MLGPRQYVYENQVFHAQMKSIFGLPKREAVKSHSSHFNYLVQLCRL